jgi:cytochrome c oxidase assembly factor CtaG
MPGIEPRSSGRPVRSIITMPTEQFCAVMNLQTSAVMPDFPFADVMQPYQLQVHNVFVMGGNVAVLRCTIPSFVRGLVQVTNWLKDEHLLERTVIHPGGRYVLSVGTRLS